MARRIEHNMQTISFQSIQKRKCCNSRVYQWNSVYSKESWSFFQRLWIRPWLSESESCLAMSWKYKFHSAYKLHFAQVWKKLGITVRFNMFLPKKFIRPRMKLVNGWIEVNSASCNSETFKILSGKSLKEQPTAVLCVKKSELAFIKKILKMKNVIYSS